MNDITRYLARRREFKAGDILAFQGVAPVSRAIDVFSGSPISHVAIVRQAMHQNGPFDVMIAESTIEGGRSGAQTNPLSGTLASYGDGARAWWLPLSAEVRAAMHWEGFWKAIGAADGITRYDVPGLFGFLARQIPVIGPRVFQSENQKQMVCSAYVESILEAAGVLRGINASKVTPADLVEMKIYRESIQLIGKPGSISRFNTA